ATVETDKQRFDYTIFIPMRYSTGMVLGNNPIGIYGPFTAKAYGHPGFTNILCWADPERHISVAILTSGKAILGKHLFPLFMLLSRISFYCKD
ncbi:MAG: serine hydrolase, partial [Nitrospirae bacterium]